MLEDDQEAILKKKGAELFRELKRLYPGATVEDYYVQGAWKDDVLAVDWQLISAHRREAGAEDPPALEDVPMPVVPKPTPLAGLGARPSVPSAAPSALGSMGSKLLAMAKAKAKAAAAARLGVAGAKAFAVKPAGLAAPKAGPKVVGSVGLVSAKAAAPSAAGAVTNPAQELRQIAVFVAKWRLDPTRTKMMLAKLGPIRRRYVMQNFKPTGGPPTDSLQVYIATCERTNSWQGAAGAPAAAAKAGGVKRPWTPSAATAATPSKYPRLMSAAPKANYMSAAPSRSQALAKAGGAEAAAKAGPAGSLAARAAAIRQAQPKAAGPLAGSLAARKLAAARPSGPRPTGSVAAKPAALAASLSERIAAVRARNAASAAPTAAMRFGAMRPAAARPGAVARPTGQVRPGQAAVRLGPTGARPQAVVYGGVLRGGGAQRPVAAGYAGRVGGVRPTGALSGGWGSGGARPATSSLLGGPRPKAVGGPMKPGAAGAARKY